jgi:hypothetical protein
MRLPKPEKNLPKLYKVLTKDGRAPFNPKYEYSLPKDGKPGRWHWVKKDVVPCVHGLHCTDEHNLYRAWFDHLDYRLFEVETSGPVYNDGSKYVCKHLRLAKEIEPASWVLELRDVCAEVLAEYENLEPSEICPDNVKIMEFEDVASHFLENWRLDYLVEIKQIEISLRHMYNVAISTLVANSLGLCPILDCDVARSYIIAKFYMRSGYSVPNKLLEYFKTHLQVAVDFRCGCSFQGIDDDGYIIFSPLYESTHTYKEKTK